MIAGSGARARTFGPGLGTPGGPTVPGLTAAPCAPRTAARSAGSSPQGWCSLWSARRGSGTGLRVDGGRKLPPGQGAHQKEPAAARPTLFARLRERRGAQ